LLSKSDSKELMSLLKEDFICLSDAVKQTSIFFLKYESDSDANSVSHNFVEGMHKLMDVIMSSGITLADITKAHSIMRKFYMARRSELYLHPCLVAIILALTRKYKVTFEDVYNMVCSAMKNEKWKTSFSFTQENPMKKALVDLQPLRQGDFSFEKLLRTKPELLSKLETFWFDTCFVGIQSTESDENLKIIEKLVESVIAPLLLNEAYSKNVLKGSSSCIELMNTMLSFRLTGDTFTHFMALFGINVGDIKKDSSPPSEPTDFLNAFVTNVFPIISNVAKSKFDCELYGHKKTYPEFNSLSKDDRSTVNHRIRDHIKTQLVSDLIQIGFGFDISLEENICPNILFNKVKSKTDALKKDFFYSLLKCINDGLYGNTFSSFKARKLRIVNNVRFKQSHDGEKCGNLTFGELVPEEEYEEDDAEFQTPNEIFDAIQELLCKINGANYEKFQNLIKQYPPEIMACRELIPLFHLQSEEEPFKFPEMHLSIFQTYLGELINEEMGGIDTFKDLVKSSDEKIVEEYADVIGFGEESKYDGISGESYGRFLYLLSGLQYFLSIEVKDVVSQNLDPNHTMNQVD